MTTVIPTKSTTTPPPEMEVATPIVMKLVAVSFIHPITFGGVANSVRLGATCDSVTPVCWGKSGGWRELDDGELAQGLVLRRQKKDLVKNKMVLDQSFVPMSNVSEFVYGEK